MPSNMWEALESRLHLSATRSLAPETPRGLGNHRNTWPTVEKRWKESKPTQNESTGTSPTSGTTPLTDPTPMYGTLNELGIQTDTGEKPQSKLWEYDGSWFGVFAKSDGSWVFRLDGLNWTAILKLSNSTSARADTFVQGDVTHVLLYSGTSSTLSSVKYVPGAPGTYQLWADRPTLTNVSLDSGVETATLAIDGNGRMWVASDGSSDVRVRYSDAPYTSFSAPQIIATNIGSDDISVITALPNGSVGVFWSDQSGDERFGFRTHNAGADPSPAGWNTAEIPAAQSAEADMADDHMNIAVSSDGTMFVAVKTSYDDDDLPSIALLVRRPNGVWDDLYDLDNSGTRPIVVLNERTDSLTVFYTTSEGGGNIVYKRASRENMVFGPRITALTGSLNNVTSTKQAVTDDLVVVAADLSEDLSGVRFRQGLYGDLDYDLDVDINDLNKLSTEYGKLSGAWWSEGDFDNDGDVDLDDLSQLAAFYGTNLA